MEHSSKRKQMANGPAQKRQKFCKMVSFSGIPYHTQMDILKKLDFKDFVNFKKCSKETVEIAKNLRHPLPFKVHQINIFKDFIRVDIAGFEDVKYNSFMDEPVRFISEELNVYSTISNGIQMEDFVRKFVIRAKSLDFSVDDQTDSSTFINLIKISKATSLRITEFTDLTNLIKQPEIRKLKEILIFDTKMEESDFLQLETPKIYISKDHGLTLSAINKFLKQWIQKKRIIKELTILPIPREEHHLEIFEDFEFSIEKTPRNYMGRIEVHHIYSITREDGKKLFVSLDHFDDEPRIVARESDDLMIFVRSKYPWAKM